MEYMVHALQIYALIIARVGAFMFNMPVLGGKYVPSVVKIGLAAGIAMVIFPLVELTDVPSQGPFLIDFGIHVLKEMLVGLTVGLVVAIIISGVRSTGRIIGRNMGLNMANVVDPESGMNVSIIEETLYLFYIFVFLSLNGHYFLFRAMVESYGMVPMGGFTFHESIIFQIFDILQQIFIIGFVTAMPIFGALIIVTVLLGILAKVAQKIKIILISFPVRIMVGLLLLALTMPLIIENYMLVYEQMQERIMYVIQAMY
ncbi:MAG: flagellar biosynthetic protein FliR [Candidatus Muiribacteriota bacterium]